MCGRTYGHHTGLVELEQGERPQSDLGMAADDRHRREEGDVKCVGEDTQVRAICTGGGEDQAGVRLRMFSRDT